MEPTKPDYFLESSEVYDYLLPFKLREDEITDQITGFLASHLANIDATAERIALAFNKVIDSLVNAPAVQLDLLDPRDLAFMSYLLSTRLGRLNDGGKIPTTLLEEAGRIINEEFQNQFEAAQELKARADEDKQLVARLIRLIDLCTPPEPNQTTQVVRVDNQDYNVDMQQVRQHWQEVSTIWAQYPDITPAVSQVRDSQIGAVNIALKIPTEFEIRFEE